MSAWMLAALAAYRRHRDRSRYMRRTGTPALRDMPPMPGGFVPLDDVGCAPLTAREKWEESGILTMTCLKKIDEPVYGKREES